MMVLRHEYEPQILTLPLGKLDYFQANMNLLKTNANALYTYLLSVRKKENIFIILISVLGRRVVVCELIFEVKLYLYIF